MNDGFEDRLSELVKGIGQENDTDVFIYCGDLTRPHDREFLDVCPGGERTHPNVLLLLTTYGGDASVAFRIARCLQKVYEKVSIFIHTFCKSAGTLLALGSHELIMSNKAEMGPLDVQLLKADELGERSSGLVIRDALENLQTQAYKMFQEYFIDLRVGSGQQITTKSAMEIAANLAIGLFSPIYSQVDPIRMGENQRAIRIAWEYGERIKTDNVKKNTISQLIMGYPDHGFIIDDEEAKSLFNIVRQPTDNEFALAEHLLPFAENTLKESTGKVFNLTKQCLIYDTEKNKGGNHEQESATECQSDGSGGQPATDEDNSEVKETATGTDESGKKAATGGNVEGKEAAALKSVKS